MAAASPSAVALAFAFAICGAACRTDRQSPEVSLDLDAPSIECAPLVAYCRPSDAILLWGRCDERWDEEVMLACATSPSNILVKTFTDCQGYGVVSQRGADFGRVLYFDGSKRLVGVEELFKQKHCYGVVPTVDLGACSSHPCGNSPR